MLKSYVRGHLDGQVEFVGSPAPEVEVVGSPAPQVEGNAEELGGFFVTYPKCNFAFGDVRCGETRGGVSLFWIETHWGVSLA